MNKMTIGHSPNDLPERAMTGFETSNAPRGECVYIILDNLGRVKIGISCAPRTRVATVLTTSGVSLSRVAVSAAIMNARRIEDSFKRDHKDKNINGEWFNHCFDAAVSYFEHKTWVLDTKENSYVDDRKDEGFLNGMKRLICGGADQVAKISTAKSVKEANEELEQIRDGLYEMAQKIIVAEGVIRAYKSMYGDLPNKEIKKIANYVADELSSFHRGVHENGWDAPFEEINR